MKRQIIKIDKEKCSGCGMCVSACHEGAIGIKDGKAVLLREDYCDGLGNCLPVCKTGAISFEEREAVGFKKAEVKSNMEQNDNLPCGCPGTNARAFNREETVQAACCPPSVDTYNAASGTAQTVSQLRQWPVQIKLVPVNAPYFNNAKLLVAADCAAYAYADFHNEFMRNKITLIGCPKQDNDYSEKLTAILKSNNIKSVTIVRMEVPCCGGIENAVKSALQNCGKMLPWQEATISTDGRLLD
jgi:ferredoxin